MLVAACALATACTDSPERRTEPIRTTASTPAPAEFGTKDDRLVRCGGGEARISPVADGPPKPQDIVVGPLRWPGLKDRARANREGYGNQQSDGWHYKIGAEIAAGARVTVSVAPEARGKAGLGYGQQWDYTPAQKVTFHACPKARTAFVGGFVVAGATGRICLPLDIRTGEAPPRRITVSLGAGKCPA